MDAVRKFDIPLVIGEEFARSLSDAIIFLDYEPGSRIVEEDICAAYGLSRSPVREALRPLEAQGLVVRSTRRGARVAPNAGERSSGEEPIDQLLICIVDPAMMQPIIADRVDQYSFELGSELAPAEALASDHNAAFRSGRNIDDTEQLTLRAPCDLAQCRQRSLQPHMVAG